MVRGEGFFECLHHKETSIIRSDRDTYYLDEVFSQCTFVSITLCLVTGYYCYMSVRCQTNEPRGGVA